MAHGFLARDRVQRMETIKKKKTNGLDLSLSDMACYEVLLNPWEVIVVAFIVVEAAFAAAVALTSWIAFQSLISEIIHGSTCTQRYLAAEAVKEAAASSHDQCWGRWRWREGDADGMRLVIQLLFVQKLWFSDDKAKARMWLVTASHSYSTSN
jgi:hypothetical protein